MNSLTNNHSNNAGNTTENSQVVFTIKSSNNSRRRSLVGTQSMLPIANTILNNQNNINSTATLSKRHSSAPTASNSPMHNVLEEVENTIVTSPFFNPVAQELENTFFQQRERANTTDALVGQAVNHMKESPEDPQAISNAAIACLKNLEESDNATEGYTLIEEMAKKNNPLALYALGVAFLNLGKEEFAAGKPILEIEHFKTSRAHLEKAVELGIPDATVKLNDLNTYFKTTKIFTPSEQKEKEYLEEIEAQRQFSCVSELEKAITVPSDFKQLSVSYNSLNKNAQIETKNGTIIHLESSINAYQHRTYSYSYTQPNHATINYLNDPVDEVENLTQEQQNSKMNTALALELLKNGGVKNENMYIEPIRLLNIALREWPENQEAKDKLDSLELSAEANNEAAYGLGLYFQESAEAEQAEKWLNIAATLGNRDALKKLENEKMLAFLALGIANIQEKHSKQKRGVRKWAEIAKAHGGKVMKFIQKLNSNRASS